MSAPIVEWSREYQRSWLRTDVVAGLTVVALLVPEGMAYAQIAGVPPQAAFYAAPIGLLAYAVFGSSRQLVVAVSSAIASMSFGAVSAVAEPSSTRFVVLTAGVAVLAGALSVLAGFLHLGRIAQFISESVMVGFITGLALLIMMKQAPKLLGISGGDGNFWQRGINIARHLGEANGATLAVALATLAVLVTIERLADRVPAALVALIAGIVVSQVLDLSHHGVETVGTLPRGLTTPHWPSLSAHDWGVLVPGAAGVALVAFAEAIGPARAFAAEHGEAIDPDQEFIGLGVANIGAGLFRGFPIGSSLSKSAANNRAGARSQVSGVVAAALTALVAVFFTGLFRPLPEAVLGAIVVVAVSGMVKARTLRRLARVRRIDAGLALVAVLAVLTLETLPALVVSVAISAFVVVWRMSTPRLAVLGRVPERLEFNDRTRHPKSEAIPGLVMVRPYNELFFANVARYREGIDAALVRADPPAEALLLDLSGTSELDVPAIEMLDDLALTLDRDGVRLILANVIDRVVHALRTAGALTTVDDADIFSTTLDAVADHLHRRGDGAALNELAAAEQEAIRRLGPMEPPET